MTSTAESRRAVRAPGARRWWSVARCLGVVGPAWTALACAQSDTSRDRADSPVETRARLTVDTIASGLEVPWALAFASAGRLFFTERVGRVRVIENGVLRRDPWATLPVAARGEAGLMGIAVAPDFAASKEVFVVGTFESGGSLVNRRT